MIPFCSQGAAVICGLSACICFVMAFMSACPLPPPFLLMPFMSACPPPPPFLVIQFMSACPPPPPFLVMPFISASPPPPPFLVMPFMSACPPPPPFTHGHTRRCVCAGGHGTPMHSLRVLRAGGAKQRAERRTHLVGGGSTADLATQAQHGEHRALAGTSQALPCESHFLSSPVVCLLSFRHMQPLLSHAPIGTPNRIVLASVHGAQSFT
jgi:hypothetical protein